MSADSFPSRFSCLNKASVFDRHVLFMQLRNPASAKSFIGVPALRNAEPQPQHQGRVPIALSTNTPCYDYAEMY